MIPLMKKGNVEGEDGRGVDGVRYEMKSDLEGAGHSYTYHVSVKIYL